MSTSAAPRPAMDPGRRGSWWRRVTNKMKRKSSGLATPRATTPAPGATSSATAKETTTAMRAITPTTIPTQQRLEARDTPEPAPIASTSAVPMASPLVADTGLAVDTDTGNELEEPLFPMLSSRTGITQDRARELFAKYGMEHGVRSKQATSEPPTKIRRVEKPVRLRVHWTCHECSRQFGMEKTCHGCGHRRCRDCTRHPPKRIREAIENTRRELEQQQQEDTNVPVPTTETVPAVDPDVLRYQEEPSAPVTEQPQTSSPQGESDPKGEPRTLAPPVSGSLLASSLELDDDADDEEVDMPNIEFSIYARPRAGVHAVLKPKAQVVRRSCHKCEKQILPPNRTECQNCGHERCDQCPRYPSKGKQRVTESPPPMVQAVQRVYRKPRQRVRYTCERCNTLFLDSDRCLECGHERCHNCVREPPKKTPERLDPAVVQSVADRLAAYGGGYGPPGITASAG